MIALDGTEITLRTGDELLCSGKGRLSRLIIQYNMLAGAQGGAIPISHVAKYVGGMVFEATTLNEWCGKKGYQKNPFYQWLDNYNGSVWVRQMQGVQIDETDYIIAASELIGTPYESGIPGVLELALTRVAVKLPWLQGFARKHLQTKNLHCSEANVILSQEAGYYDDNVRPNKMPPYTFWPGGLYEKGILTGSLGPAIQIK